MNALGTMLTSFAITAGLIICAVEANAVPDKRADYASKMVELGQWQPPKIEGSYQRIDTRNGLQINSNVPDRRGLKCRIQVGEDAPRELILFEHCVLPPP